MTKNLFPQNQMVAPEFDLKSIYQTVLKSVFTVFLLLCSMGVFGASYITCHKNNLEWNSTHRVD